MMDNIIEINKLGYKVGWKWLLRDVNWNVKTGERWIIFGLNGSGKTTLLSILSGYKSPTEGCVKVFGTEYTNENLIEQRKRIGLVSTSYFDHYFSNESALQIVLSGKTGAVGLDFDINDQDVKNAKKLLRKLGLDDKLDQSYSLLSKGERENVLIARALIAKPELLILDEPCSGLDVIARDKMLKTIEHLALRKDQTMIYVTHYTEELLECFDHTVLLRNGKVYKKGKSAEVFTQECMQDFLREKVEVVRDDHCRLSIYSSDISPIDLSEEKMYGR